MLESLFLAMLKISLTTAVVIAALGVLSPFINERYAAKWKYWIWLILAVRLLIPFGITISKAPITVNVPNLSLSEIAPLRNDLNTESGGDIIVSPSDSDSADTNEAQTADPLPQQGRMMLLNLSLLEAMMLLWLFGFVVFFLIQIRSYHLFKRSILRWSRKLPDSRAETLITEISRDLSLKRSVITLLSEKTESPLMFGFIRPHLILPHNEYSDEDLRFVLRHELTHCRKNDVWYKLLLLVVNAVHWFNPFVYLMFREASADLELICDDEVTRHIPYEKRRAYSETILAAIQMQRIRRTALSTYYRGGNKDMKNRFKNILNRKPRKSGALILSVTVLITVFVGGLASCTSNIPRDGDVTDTPRNDTPSSDYSFIWTPEGEEEEYLTLGIQSGTFPWGRTINYQLDETTTSGDMPGMEFHRVHGGELDVYIEYSYIEETDTEVLRSLQTTSDNYQTTRGVNVGDTVNDILAAYNSDLLYILTNSIVYSSLPANFCNYDEMYIYTRDEDDDWYIAFYVENFEGEQIIRGIEMSIGWEGPTYSADGVNIFTVYAENEEIPEELTQIHDLYSAGNDTQSIIIALQDINWADYYQAYGDETYEIIGWLNHQELSSDDEILAVLKATDGLDSAVSEGYASILANLYLKDNLRFIRLASSLNTDDVNTVASLAVYGLAYENGFTQYIADLTALKNSGEATAAERTVIERMLYYMNLAQT